MQACMQFDHVPLPLSQRLLSDSVSVCLTLPLCVSHSISLSHSLSHSLYLCVSLTLCLSLSVSLYLSLSTSLSVSPSVSLCHSVCLTSVCHLSSMPRFHPLAAKTKLPVDTHPTAHSCWPRHLPPVGDTLSALFPLGGLSLVSWSEWASLGSHHPCVALRRTQRPGLGVCALSLHVEKLTREVHDSEAQAPPQSRPCVSAPVPPPSSLAASGLRARLPDSHFHARSPRSILSVTLHRS